MLKERFQIKNVKSPWKKDKGANIDSPVYTYKKGDRPLGVIYGCFSPFTGKYGHARLLDRGEQEGIEDFIIVSPYKNQPIDNDRNMFTLQQKVKIAEAGCKDLGYNILGAYTSKAHFFLDALYEYAEMYPDYRLVLICGPDRADLYGKYCVPFGEDYELQDENDIGKFEILYCTDRGDKEVSGTKVREAIRNGDRDAFLEMTGYSDEMWNLCVKFAAKNGVLGESTMVNEYYSNPEFDDYALMVRNALMRTYDVDIEDANWVVDEENTADYMHSVWFEMKPEVCADNIVKNLIISDGYVDKDAYRKVVLVQRPKRTPNYDWLEDNTKSTFKKLLNEDTHSLHMEDSILKGKAYISRMLGFYNQVFDTLTGSIDKEKPGITVKIDGAPAITMYTKFPGLKGPGVSTKSIFNATPKVYTTDEDIEADDRSPELKAKLKAALKLAKAKIIPAGEIWQGDLLFTKGDIKNYTDDNGQKYIYFKPNTLVYALPVGSDGAKKALASDIGIVFHTRYKGSSVQTVKQSNDASTDELNGIPEWAFVLDARLPNLSGVQTLSDQEANDIEDSLYDLHSLCSEIVNDADYDLLVNNTDFINFYVMTLQNNKVDKSELIDPETFVDELHKWVTGKMRKEYQGLEKLKTKAGRDKKRISLDDKSKDLHTIIETNEPLLHKIAEALYIAADVKNQFITKLNSVNKWVNKVETTFGMKDTNGEGFMVSDVDGNFVKLVDRSAFSYFNRSPDVIKGFDARRGSTNESMNFASYLKSLES